MKKFSFLSLADASYTPWQFAFFRIIFGLYLSWHFLTLLPDAVEVFSRAGVLPTVVLNLTYPVFPWNPLGHWDSPTFVSFWVILCFGLSVAITLGWKRPCCAFLLWFGLACLFNRNNLISNPSIPYVGLLLLLLTIIPDGEPMRLGGRTAEKEWRMPALIPFVAWALMACGYSFSGLDKISSPSWVNGDALRLLLDNPLAREGALRDIMLNVPAEVLRLLTWGALAAEILFLPMCITLRGRMLAWLSLFGMHIGIMALLSFSDLSLGMIMVHLFTFDQRWFGKVSRADTTTVYYDGECGLCSRAMRFIAEEDTLDSLKMYSLQGSKGQKALRLAGLNPSSLDSILVERNGHFFNRSSAVIEICAALGGVWGLAGLGYFFPLRARDALYDLVAQKRYAVFGKSGVCEIPSPALRRKLFPGNE